MRFKEIEESILRKLTNHSRVIEGGSDYFTPMKPDANKKAMLESHRKAGRLNGNGLLDFAIGKVKEVEGRIRRTKLTGLSGSEVRKFQKSAISALVKAVEDRKSKRLREKYGEMVERERAYAEKGKNRSYQDSMKRHGRLDELKLQHTFTDESKAVATLGGMEKRGYDEIEVLILGSKGERAHNRAAELRETLPPFLSDDAGVQLLGEIKELVELRAGEISYSLKNFPNVQQKVNIADLMTDLVPRIEDISA